MRGHRDDSRLLRAGGAIDRAQALISGRGDNSTAARFPQDPARRLAHECFAVPRVDSVDHAHHSIRLGQGGLAGP